MKGAGGHNSSFQFNSIKHLSITCDTIHHVHVKSWHKYKTTWLLLRPATCFFFIPESNKDASTFKIGFNATEQMCKCINQLNVMYKCNITICL